MPEEEGVSATVAAWGGPDHLGRRRRNVWGIFMSAADNNDVQGSWVSILLICAIGVIRKFSSAGARDGVEPRISVAH
jgi:hypothetical protein